MLERNKEKGSLPLKQQIIVHGFIVFRFAGNIELLVNVSERPSNLMELSINCITLSNTYKFSQSWLQGMPPLWIVDMFYLCLIIYSSAQVLVQFKVKKKTVLVKVFETCDIMKKQTWNKVRPYDQWSCKFCWCLGKM